MGSGRVLPAAGQARPAYDTYKGLAQRLGVADVYPWTDQEAAMNAALDHPATGHTTVGEMRANGGRTALKVSHIAYPSLAFTTPSGKIAFHAQRAAEMGLAALPSYTAGHAGQGGLALAHGRTFAHFHAFYDHGRALPTLATGRLAHFAFQNGNCRGQNSAAATATDERHDQARCVAACQHA